MSGQMSQDERLLLELLKRVVQQKATDLHIGGGSPPILRIRGELVPISSLGIITPERAQKMLFSIMSEFQQEEFLNNKELDLSYEGVGVGRFRVNIFFEKNSIGAAFRTIPDDPIPLDKIGVPMIMRKVCEKRNGLVLLTGATGSGKTTTLAACIDYINSIKNLHIITIEDPIEYVHKNKKALVRQREVGIHTNSFASALRVCLRQDPDVILVGEMRDLETTSIAITAAETGHLVFSTLHTNGAVDSIARIIDIFPSEHQTAIRVQLSSVFEAILSQILLPNAAGTGILLACELLLATPAVRNIIREGRLHILRSSLETGMEHGMQSLEVCLKDLYLKGKITFDAALARCNDVEAFKKLTGMSATL